MTKIPLTILSADSRPYTSKDGLPKKWNAINTLIDGQVVEITGNDEMVAVCQEELAKKSPIETTASVKISQTSFNNKKSTSITLLSLK